MVSWTDWSEKRRDLFLERESEVEGEGEEGVVGGSLQGGCWTYCK